LAGGQRSLLPRHADSENDRSCSAQQNFNLARYFLTKAQRDNADCAKACSTPGRLQYFCRPLPPHPRLRSSAGEGMPVGSWPMLA